MKRFVVSLSAVRECFGHFVGLVFVKEVVTNLGSSVIHCLVRYCEFIPQCHAKMGRRVFDLFSSYGREILNSATI